MNESRLRLVIVVALLGCFYAANAQKRALTFGIVGGATHVDWEDNISRGANKTFQPRFDFFAGVQATRETTLLKNLSWNARFYYKESSVWVENNDEVLKIDDINFGLSPNYRYKRLRFGLHPTFSYIVRKRKVDNTPNSGLKVEDFKNAYASLSASLSFSLNQNMDVFVERAFLSTSIYDANRLNRFGVPTSEKIGFFKRWALIGVSYHFNQK